MEPTFFELLFTSGTLEHGIFSFTGTIVIVSGLLLVLRENTKRITQKIDKLDGKIETNEKSINNIHLDHARLRTEFDTRKDKT